MMSFQGQATPAVLPQNGAQAELRSVADLGKLLAAGSVVNIQIAEDPANPQNLGIFYNGRFFPALVPENVKAGSRLQVSVLEKADAVILKILGAIEPKSNDYQSTTQALSRSYPALMRDLNSLLTEEPPKELKSIWAPLKEELLKLGTGNKPLAELPPPIEGEISDSKSVGLPLSPQTTPTINKESDKSVAGQIEKILSKMLSKIPVIESESLEQPDKTYQTLTQSSTNSVLKNVNEAKDALQKLSGQNLTPKELFVLKSLEQEIGRILKQIPAPEGQVTPPSPNRDPADLVKTQGGIPTIPLSPEIEKKITLLFEALKGLKLTKQKEDGAEVKVSAKDGFQQFVLELQSEFNEVLSKKTPDVAREALTKALKNLKERFALDRYTPEESKYIQSSMQALSSLESLTQAQETLNQLNPIMEAMGEPMLILFPMLTSGMLSKLKLSAENQRVDPDAGGKTGAEQGEMTKIDFALQLPSIGEVQVNLSHSKVEIFATLVFEREDIAEIARGELGKLTSRLQSLGFASINLNVKAGETKEITPAWVREISWRDGIVA